MTVLGNADFCFSLCCTKQSGKRVGFQRWWILEADFICFANSHAKCKGNNSEEWDSLLKNAFLPLRDALWCPKCLIEIYPCDEPRQGTKL